MKTKTAPKGKSTRAATKGQPEQAADIRWGLVEHPLPLTLDPQTLERWQKATDTNTPQDLIGWIERWLDETIATLECVTNSDPMLSVSARSAFITPFAHVTVQMPRRVAERLLAYGPNVVKGLGEDVARFAWDAERSFQARQHGRRGLPDHERPALFAYGDIRGRKDNVAFEVRMKGHQWESVQKVAAMLNVKPRYFIRAALWFRLRDLEQAGEEKAAARMVQAQIAKPAKSPEERPTNANPLGQSVDLGDSIILRGVACRNVVFEMPQRMLAELRDYARANGWRDLHDCRSSPEHQSILLGQPKEGEPRETFVRSSSGIPSRKKRLRMVMNEMLAGPSERVVLYLPEEDWQRIVARSKRFGITPAEDCATSIAYHVIMHRQARATSAA